jgi:hypothetical protein
MARPRPVLLRGTLGAVHSNLMLRCMRAIRLLRIEMTTMRLIYVRLFVAMKMMENSVEREDVQLVIYTLSTDVLVCNRDGVTISDCLKVEVQKVCDIISCKVHAAVTRMAMM